MMAGGECRKSRHEQHQGDTDNDKPRHDLVVLHRLAGMWPRCPRVVDGILRALHRYSSLEIPTPDKTWADSNGRTTRHRCVKNRHGNVTSLVGRVLRTPQQREMATLRA